MISKIFQLWALVAGVATLVGCSTSPLPVPENFPLTMQSKVRSAGHWNLLAKDVVAQTIGSLNKANLEKSNLYVALPPNSSSFDKAFYQFLVTELVKNGLVVVQNPGAALELNYQTQVVNHKGPRPQFAPGKYSMIAAGLIAMYSLRLEHFDTKLAGGWGFAAAGDALSSMDADGPTHTELILTTTVVGDGRYLVRKTDVYYIEEVDQNLMLPLPPAPPAPLAPKTMNVVGS